MFFYTPYTSTVDSALSLLCGQMYILLGLAQCVCVENIIIFVIIFIIILSKAYCSPCTNFNDFNQKFNFNTTFHHCSNFLVPSKNLGFVLKSFFIFSSVLFCHRMWSIRMYRIQYALDTMNHTHILQFELYLKSSDFCVFF